MGRFNGGNKKNKLLQKFATPLTKNGKGCYPTFTAYHFTFRASEITMTLEQIIQNIEAVTHNMQLACTSEHWEELQILEQQQQQYLYQLNHYDAEALNIIEKG